jgi:hypothetical protein
VTEEQPTNTGSTYNKQFNSHRRILGLQFATHQYAFDMEVEIHGDYET